MTPDRGPRDYTDIAAALRRDTADGVLTAEGVLPTEVKLCETSDASRGPDRQALAILRAEGLISSGRGHRTMVIDEAPPAVLRRRHLAFRMVPCLRGRTGTAHAAARQDPGRPRGCRRPGYPRTLPDRVHQAATPDR